MSGESIGVIVAFSFRLFGPALVAMVALLLTLIVLHERVVGRGQQATLTDHVFVIQPFVIYLAWISVALISNTFQFVTYVEWGGFGVPGEAWSVVMMAVATGLGVFMLIHRRAWAFPLVVAWALFGIGQRYAELAVISGPAYALVGLSLLVPPALALLVLSRRRTS